MGSRDAITTALSETANPATLQPVTHRVAITALAALAITMASTATQGAELAQRFSLLGDTLEPTSCLLRSDARVDDLGAPDLGGCVLLTVPLLTDVANARPSLTGHDGDGEITAPADEDAGVGAFALSRNWTAAVAYHHELLFPTATSRDLRTRRFSLFSADQDRDVLDLRLSWRLTQLSDLDFGYQLQSNRASLAGAGEAYSVRRFVSDADLDYALTIGITRRFNSGK